MVIPFVVPETLGGWNHPPDAIKLSEKADAINRIYFERYFQQTDMLFFIAIVTAKNWTHNFTNQYRIIMEPSDFVEIIGLKIDSTRKMTLTREFVI